ncbi:hypothetical protein DXX99_08950 [Ammonifex thiophilus]|uniref:Uncharacterized protein n=1 Tax=Ammonifex thiophilus TaxID=444093 RepID=A0A3D8P3K0_9THEO|nr:hypothetical protein DXX99_08950 [Ammonifex thiophilus]
MPPESLPAAKSPVPPRSRLHFLRQVGLVQYLILTAFLLLPELVISALVGAVPIVQAVLRGAATLALFIPLILWAVVQDFSPSFYKARVRHLVVSGILAFITGGLAIGAASAAELVVIEEAAYYAGVLFAALPYMLEAGYRAAKKDWAAREPGENERDLGTNGNV